MAASCLDDEVDARSQCEDPEAESSPLTRAREVLPLRTAPGGFHRCAVAAAAAAALLLLCAGAWVVAARRGVGQGRANTEALEVLTENGGRLRAAEGLAAAARSASVVNGAASPAGVGGRAISPVGAGDGDVLEFYNCKVGRANWRDGWTKGKKEFCCNSAGFGCEDGVPREWIIAGVACSLLAVAVCACAAQKKQADNKRMILAASSFQSDTSGKGRSCCICFPKRAPSQESRSWGS